MNAENEIIDLIKYKLTEKCNDIKLKIAELNRCFGIKNDNSFSSGPFAHLAKDVDVAKENIVINKDNNDQNKDKKNVHGMKIVL